MNHRLDGFRVIASLVVLVIADRFETDRVGLALLLLVSFCGPLWRCTARLAYSKVGKCGEILRVCAQYNLMHVVFVGPTDDCQVSEATTLEQPVTRVSRKGSIASWLKNPPAQALLECYDLIAVVRHCVWRRMMEGRERRRRRSRRRW